MPEWNGLKSGVYGDIGTNAKNAFKRLYGVEIPDFRDPSSASYYLRDSERYRLWVEFRVNAVNGFINEIFNGEGGVRQARPGIGVATWSLAVRGGTEAVDKLREEQGLESAAMIKEVSPDIHFLQTHWPDWMDPFFCQLGMSKSTGRSLKRSADPILKSPSGFKPTAVPRRR